jgi:uncharacterized membrane protein (UPF0127 family)
MHRVLRRGSPDSDIGEGSLDSAELNTMTVLRFIYRRRTLVRLGWIALFVLLLFWALGALGGWKPWFDVPNARAELSTTLPKAKVKAGGQVFRVDVAELPEDQARGLGGRKALKPDEGMIFVYRDRHEPGFWMHGMIISIDMLWIDTDRIVHIVHRAPPPKPGTPDVKLEVYSPPAQANFVLEIAAGRAKELGLKVGDKVEFDFSGK